MKTIIFDFDGTIADTFALVVRIFEDVVRNSTPVTEAELNRLRKVGLSARWAQELGIPFWKAPFLLAKGRTMMRRRMQHIQTFDGMAETLKALHGTDAVLIVMSSNNKDTIERFLAREGLDTYFTQIYGGAGLFKKAHVLKGIVRQSGLDPADTYYVGDEVRDVEAAKRAGIHSVSVTWGFNAPSLLQKHEPDYIAHTPAKLAAVFGVEVPGNGA